MEQKIMRGMTLYQPWAADVAEGRKRYETRGHRTSYRGVLAIHAGVNRSFLPTTGEWMFMRPRTGAVLVPEPPGVLARRYRGGLLAETVRPDRAVRESLDDTELDVGDWSDGRYGWVFHVNHSCRSCDNHSCRSDFCSK